MLEEPCITEDFMRYFELRNVQQWRSKAVSAAFQADFTNCAVSWIPLKHTYVARQTKIEHLVMVKFHQICTSRRKSNETVTSGQMEGWPNPSKPTADANISRSTLPRRPAARRRRTQRQCSKRWKEFGSQRATTRAQNAGGVSTQKAEGDPLRLNSKKFGEHNVELSTHTKVTSQKEDSIRKISAACVTLRY